MPTLKNARKNNSSQQTSNSHSELFNEALSFFTGTLSDQDCDQAASLLYAAFKQGDERAMQFVYEAMKNEDENVITALYRLKEKNPADDGIKLLFYHCAARYYADHSSLLS